MEKKIFEDIFLSAADGLYLLFRSGEIKRNKAAVELEKQMKVPLQKIIEIANGKGCMLHTTMENCLNCEVKENWTKEVFPLILETKDGRQEHFSGSLTEVSDEVELLSLRRADAQDKLRQVIENKRLIEYVNQAHETERKAISQELHDGLAQSIYSLMLDVRLLKRLNQKEEQLYKISEIDKDFVELLREVKQLAIDLRPTALDDLGLIPAIEALLQRLMETTGVMIHFIPVLGQQRFSDKVETVTYRVLQESLMNSIKYAEVDEIWVMLHDRENLLHLEVRDHGKGFSIAGIRKETSGGLGLLHMRERAESVGGILNIQSEIEKGTTVVLMLPIKQGGTYEYNNSR
ncbi:sensor histidine kinase [Enterococcus sp. BWT-B8]|uniref:sensor histidine kinase n=1 Tax=Enterococcus sp. BWT-B8 TaxID=2885157 RepID=UPI001E491220|nr:sensor histidine kinase [Enterococcus sp. BWT-B8]MCB5951610.1 sensor histidine kinase [Enterococcus sp. BWT-B8]